MSEIVLGCHRNITYRVHYYEGYTQGGHHPPQAPIPDLRGTISKKGETLQRMHTDVVVVLVEDLFKLADVRVVQGLHDRNLPRKRGAPCGVSWLLRFSGGADVPTFLNYLDRVPLAVRTGDSLHDCCKRALAEFRAQVVISIKTSGRRTSRGMTVYKTCIRTVSFENTKKKILRTIIFKATVVGLWHARAERDFIAFTKDPCLVLPDLSTVDLGRA